MAEMTLPELLFRIEFHKLQSAYLVQLCQDTGLRLTELQKASEVDKCSAAARVLARHMRALEEGWNG